MATPKKYDHIDFTPPKSVQQAAKRGLKMRRKYGRGGLSRKEASKQGIGSGVQRAINLSNGDQVSPDTIKRMVSFFARHKKNKDSRTDSGEPGNGMIAWAIWGGDPGERWANKVNEQMKKADEAEKNKSLAMLADMVMVVRSTLQEGGNAGNERYNHPAPLTYKSEAHTGAMVALFLPTSTGVDFVLNRSDAIPPNEMHVTLSYLGKADELTDWQIEHLHEIIEMIAENYPPLQGNINGCGRFCNNEDVDPFFIIPDLPKLPALRQIVVDFIDSRCEIDPSSNHGFSPHITLGYVPHSNPNPFDSVELTPVTFPTISLVLADKRYDYPFLMGLDNISKALVQMAGARHTAQENAQIQKMHDMSLELGAECHPLTRRAGARHSAADQAMIQRIHDNCASLGATCKALPEPDRLYYGQVMKEGEIIKGSAGSGNYGHDGRPGKKGGSTKGGGLRRIGAKKDTPPGDRKKAAKKFREKKGAKRDNNKKAIEISGKLNQGHKKALNSFKNEGSLGVDISSISGIVKGKKITKKGADTVNYLIDNDLIRQTSLIGPSGYPRMKATELGKQVLSLKAFLTIKAQSDAPNYKAAYSPERCDNCAFFRGDPGEDYCTRFDFVADPDYICDDWEAVIPDEIPGYVANKADLARLTEGVISFRNRQS